MANKKAFHKQEKPCLKTKMVQRSLNWLLGQWKRVIWTDASPFVLHGNQEKIWKKKVKHIT